MTVAVDLFAGWGGFTLAAQSVGVRVAWAANHQPVCVAGHALNFPETVHACQDLRQADWSTLPRYDLLLASPACQGHSPASQPRRRVYHDAMRATAWAVVDCVEATLPRAVIVENVLAFRTWQLLPLWRAAFEQLGYHVDEHIVTASYFGVPQRRTRLFFTMARRRRSIRLEPTLLEPAFGPHVELDAEGWRPVRAAPADVQGRIAKGRRNYGRRFLSQHTTGHPGVPLDEPIRTITTKDQWILVEGDSYRPLTLREYARGMGFPDTYRWPADVSRKVSIRGLGNAVSPPPAARLIEQVAA